MKSKQQVVNLNSDAINRLIRSKGIFNKSDIKPFTKFNRFGYFDLYNTIGEPKEYIFITKPNLHIFNGSSDANLNSELDDPFFRECMKRHKDCLRSLQYSLMYHSPFINILTDKVRNNVDLPSINAGESETAANIFGDFQVYRRGSGSSYVNHEFSLEFEDTKNLDVYMIFKIWDKYCDKKYKGIVTPPSKSYTLEKILHDQVSLYKFIIDDDKETILHYTKMWGVFPKDVPLTTFSSLDSGVIKHSVEFHSTFVDDMDPLIISDFNILCDKFNKNGFAPRYQKDINGMNNDWVSMPYIIYDKNKKVYKLKWRK